MKILNCELHCKLSNYFNSFPQKNGCWNSGLIFHNNEWILPSRNEISPYNNDYWKWSYPTQNTRIVPLIVRLNPDFSFKSCKEAIKSQDLTLSDVRIFIHNNELFYTGTFRSKTPCPDGKKRVNQFLAKYIDDYLIFLPFNHSLQLPQKNWIPISINSELYFENINQTYPSKRIIFHYSGGVLNPISITHCPYNIRGNTQSIELDNFILTLYHYHSKRYYWHQFGFLEKCLPFNIIQLSDKFRFQHGQERIQFAMGMTKYENRVFISYGVQDSDNYIVSCTVEDILKLKK